LKIEGGELTELPKDYIRQAVSYQPRCVTQVLTKLK